MGLALLLLALVLAACANVRGNTEVRRFRLDLDTPMHQSPLLQRRIDGVLPNQTALAAPFTTSGIEAIYAAESTTASSEDRVRWYRLQGLEPGRSYELRVSYAATPPSSFDIALYSVLEVLRLFNAAPGREETPHMQDSAPRAELDMYAKVTVSYTGHSHIVDMENRQVRYIIALERHVLGLPVRAYKLVGALVVVVIFSLLVVAPRILAAADAVLAEDTKQHKKD
ncbi:hypothetical protein LPJ61_001178 [Coemansia biformis]|uniref:Uncharacterized protein n=1 Tax=Coemansia biformis TaxID=1286918 RepID=A0A9W7YAG9_9FUNG|nr:hypothetical protein LPJ61_001178 [Coemansia biformis]